MTKNKNKNNSNLGAKSNMSTKAASRIQSAADRSGKGAGFKARAQSAAAKNASTTSKGSKK